MRQLKKVMECMKGTVVLPRVRPRTESRRPMPWRTAISGQSLVMLMAVAVLLLGSALPSFAITAPTSGSLFYDVYDIVVNSMLKGAIGFVAAILVFMMGIGLFFVQKIIPGIIGVVCAALIIKADAIVTTLGLTF
ncbi:hypothetical protein [Syntrophorhabdus aromaticivorans]|jgi:hypothetical protein|uniref:hypothetical protein n=1 Tax=Syntrophorhabdus aromaticivorans TaxID=328301 RepID=UPI0012EC9E2D|nr:hypothetical protein [Syntrophorhabdus aromaticivorans]